MTRPTKDEDFHALFQDLRRLDAAQAPRFDPMLRAARSPGAQRSPWRTPAISLGIGFTLVGAAAMVSMLLQSPEGLPRHPAPNRVVPAGLTREPLASLMQRPGSSWEGFETSPIPKRRLTGGWE